MPTVQGGGGQTVYVDGINGGDGGGGGNFSAATNMDAIEEKYLVLPLHTKMSVEDVGRVCAAIREGW